MYERKFMLRALKCAQKAYEIDDVPVGCVIVHEGKVTTGAKTTKTR